MSGKHWRQLTVWLHVVSSVGWLSQALALVSLLALALAATDSTVTLSALTMAKHLDMSVLAQLANVSAFTGFMLAATTAWGFFRHWWVLLKFAITIVQLYVGIFVLAPTLRGSALTGQTSVWMLVGAVVMAGAIGFQAWLSIAKPWGRTQWTSREKPPTAPRWVFVVAVLAPVADVTVGTVLGFPLPALSVLALIMRLALRSTTRRTPVRELS